MDWYPWGQEAFEEARARDKPIFLSVGYSTCHWWAAWGQPCWRGRTFGALWGLDACCLDVIAMLRRAESWDLFALGALRTDGPGTGDPSKPDVTPSLVTASRASDCRLGGWRCSQHASELGPPPPRIIQAVGIAHR